MTRPKRIKILHIIPTLDMGGAERLLVDIVKGLDKERFEPVVVCFKRGGVWERELAASARLIIIRRNSKFDLFSIFKLNSLIKTERPDIVHTHLGGDIYGRLFAGLAGVPVVSTEHNLNRDESMIITLAKRLTLPFAKKVIAVSAAVAKDAAQRYGLSEQKTIVIHNGVDLARFSFVERFPTGQIRLGSVGRLTTQKDFSTLIQAVAKLKDHSFSLEIAGEGPLRGELEKLIKELGLGSKVALLGNRSDIPSFLQTLDIFILPSLWEGLGIVVLEAALSGLPVIAARVDGLTEIIDEGTNGLFFEAGDSDALAAAILKLLGSPELARRLAAALADKVKQDFSLEKMVRAYERVYEQAYGK